MAMKIINKMLEKYGDIALFPIVLCSILAFVGWVFSTLIFVWPILLPFLVLGRMAYVANKEIK